MATTPIGLNRISGLSFVNMCGFGYDNKIDDYKVVRIAVPYNIADIMVSQVDVYTLVSVSWRMVKDTPYEIIGRSPEEVFDKIPYLVTFEEFEHKRVDTLEGSLCMLCSSAVGFEVWMMSEYGFGDFGTKLYSIFWLLLPKIVDIVPSFLHLRRIQSLRNGEFLLEIQLSSYYAGLSFYDPKHEKARVMIINQDTICQKCVFGVT
ncbi:F-box protein CPR1-like [Papaver somniferum]|uniref:F-box protein CPR1-like n=1 Tax=Papaver somniferum TaxID=3469 RepID=UPI000E6FEEF2|nr:F-box protein CPR1-like [Papaver somniferum]